MIRCAKFSDLPQVAEIFREAFSDSINFYFNNKIKNSAIEDIFKVVLLAEPHGFLVYEDRENKKIAGYICVVKDIKKVWLAAILSLSVFKWAIKWMLGLYGFGVKPIWKILSNKLDFFKFQTKYAGGISAQILSIGTRKSYRGKNIGTQLVEAGLNFLKSRGVKQVKLEVRPDNLPAIKLYKKFGFYQIGMSQDPQGKWIVMKKDF
ncbi:GNAT family N-acetyltransferase [Caldicellulosiruptor morganii]|uniref:GNAT family N-acetyltransferase n=1 Tax=Caldicellulosiruptor morganii TaxID=1387555 RepID=A0ABY7BMZ6_9FIRM|nr:GNAT family N-acetyltransferase [Caldicellulosiruptor morganii]WAM33257.1 GNAT family N-acetyltransferase [Caldicellulosiruptor morganii]